VHHAPPPCAQLPSRLYEAVGAAASTTPDHLDASSVVRYEVRRCLNQMVSLFVTAASSIVSALTVVMYSHHHKQLTSWRSQMSQGSWWVQYGGDGHHTRGGA
jgi:hypothetical protein